LAAVDGAEPNATRKREDRMSGHLGARADNAMGVSVRGSVN
jgi:hypothetical protein